MTGNIELKKHNDYDSNKNGNKKNVIATANENVDDSDIVTILNDGVNVSLAKNANAHGVSNRKQLEGMMELIYHDHDPSHDHDPNHHHDHDTLHVHDHTVLNRKQFNDMLELNYHDHDHGHHYIKDDQ